MQIRNEVKWDCVPGPCMDKRYEGWRIQPLSLAYKYNDRLRMSSVLVLKRPKDIW